MRTTERTFIDWALTGAITAGALLMTNLTGRAAPITASGGVPVATAVAPRRPRRPARPTRLSAEDRAKAGRSARALVSRSSHGAWAPSATRQDPIAILSEQDATRGELDALAAELRAYYDECVDVSRTRTGAFVRREKRKTARRVREEMRQAAAERGNVLGALTRRTVSRLRRTPS